MNTPLCKRHTRGEPKHIYRRINKAPKLSALLPGELETITVTCSRASIHHWVVRLQTCPRTTCSCQPVRAREWVTVTSSTCFLGGTTPDFSSSKEQQVPLADKPVPLGTPQRSPRHPARGRWNCLLPGSEIPESSLHGSRSPRMWGEGQGAESGSRCDCSLSRYGMRLQVESASPQHHRTA